jgi:hypothetical protein
MRRIFDCAFCSIAWLDLLAQPQISLPYVQIGFIIVLYMKSLFSIDSCDPRIDWRGRKWWANLTHYTRSNRKNSWIITSHRDATTTDKIPQIWTTSLLKRPTHCEPVFHLSHPLMNIIPCADIMSPSFLLAQVIFEPNRTNAPTISSRLFYLLTSTMMMEDSAQKRRHIKFRRRGIIQKKEYYR